MTGGDPPILIAPLVAGREELERRIRARCEAGATAEALELCLRGYGTEVMDFLVAWHRSEGEAAEVFSQTAEGIWSGLPKFGFESSVRTWIYAIARKSSLRYRRDARRRAARFAPLPNEAAEIVASLRTQTASFLATRVKDRVAELREELPDEDRLVLLLRVDRELEWTELARVVHGDDAPEGVALQREAARLRKRFQLVKEKLFERAVAEGLVKPRRKGPRARG